MTTLVELPSGALEVLMKEYDALRSEINARIQIAFSHIAYAAGIVAFAVPVSEKSAALVSQEVIFALAAIGALLLLWLAHVNWRWIEHAANRIRSIETRVNKHFGTEVLGWEQYAHSVKAPVFLFIPRSPRAMTRARSD